MIIKGNELIQYEPFNTADFLAFNADDLINSVGNDDESKKAKHNSASMYISDLYTTQIEKQDDDNKWNLIDDNFIIHNSNENLYND